jgi:hypothetical protein
MFSSHLPEKSTKRHICPNMNIIAQIQTLGIGRTPVFDVKDTVISREGQISRSIISAEDSGG